MILIKIFGVHKLFMLSAKIELYFLFISDGNSTKLMRAALEALHLRKGTTPQTFDTPMESKSSGVLFVFVTSAFLKVAIILQYSELLVDCTVYSVASHICVKVENVTNLVCSQSVIK